MHTYVERVLGDQQLAFGYGPAGAQASYPAHGQVEVVTQTSQTSQKGKAEGGIACMPFSLAFENQFPAHKWLKSCCASCSSNSFTFFLTVALSDYLRGFVSICLPASLLPSALLQFSGISGQLLSYHLRSTFFSKCQPESGSYM